MTSLPQSVFQEGYMPTAAASIHVDATPEEVFDLVSDPMRIPEYVPIVLDVFDVSEGPIGPGTTLKEHSKPGPFVTVTRWRIAEYEPPRKHVWEGHQVDMEMTLTKKITPQGSGTLYEQWMEYRYLPRLRPLGWLLEKLVVQRKIEQAFQEVVAGIKRLVEAERSPAPDGI